MDPNETEPALDPGDAEVIGALRRQGADLALPRELRHYLYFPTREMAEGVAGRLGKAGLPSEVRPAATGADWLVLAVHTAVVNEVSIGGLRPKLAAIAEAEGGAYDGWEAAATP